MRKRMGRGKRGKTGVLGLSKNKKGQRAGNNIGG